MALTKMVIIGHGHGFIFFSFFLRMKVKLEGGGEARPEQAYSVTERTIFTWRALVR